jgi:hypothetical protein
MQFVYRGQQPRIKYRTSGIRELRVKKQKNSAAERTQQRSLLSVNQPPLRTPMAWYSRRDESEEA